MDDEEILAGYANEIDSLGNNVQVEDLTELDLGELVVLLLQTEKDLNALGRISKWEDPQSIQEGRTILARREAIKYQINLSTIPEEHQ